MENKQKINCTVDTCKYNNGETNLCELESIVVTPVNNCNTKQPDESQCSNYENSGN